MMNFSWVFCNYLSIMNSFHNDWYWRCWFYNFFNYSLCDVLWHFYFNWHLNILSMYYFNWVGHLNLYRHWHGHHFFIMYFYSLHRFCLHLILDSNWYHLIRHFFVDLACRSYNLRLHLLKLWLPINRLRILHSHLLKWPLRIAGASLVSRTVSDWASNSS